jgi:hypothetical protein
MASDKLSLIPARAGHRNPALLLVALDVADLEECP